MSFELYLSNRKDIRLSRSQEKLVKSISIFLSEPKGPQCFILRGAAGSGKTFIGSLIKEYSSQGTYIFTPTGRAAKIFRSMVRNLKDRGNISTIHHGIYTRLRVKDEYTQGKPKTPYNLKKSTMIFGISENLNSKEAVYVCDESSMISDTNNFNSGLEFGTGKLLSDLFTHIENRKIIFIGDHAQLTPINMEYSPALNKSYIKERFNIEVIDFELKEVLRQNQNSGILKNATKIRNAIIGNKNVAVEINSEPDVSFINSEDAIGVAKNNFNPNRFSDFTIVTHTRVLSKEYNYKVRKSIFPDNKSTFLVGDRLMCAQTNYLYSIFNGELLRVKKVFTDEGSRVSRIIDIAPSKNEKRYSEISVGKDGKMHIELIFQKLELEYHDNQGVKGSTECYVIENAISNGAIGLDIAESRALLVDFYVRFKESKEKYLSNHNKTYLSVHEEELAVKNGDIFDREKDVYYNALVIKYGYALTAHKSQGGEWDNAIVDLSTKFWDENAEEALRWKYTSITRAKKHLYLVGSHLKLNYKVTKKEEKPISSNDIINLFGNLKPNQKSGNAYEKWEDKDDTILELHYRLNTSTKKIAEHMKRSVGAINSRLKKLKLKE